MKTITDQDFKQVMDAVRGELRYQDSLPRRTEDGEAQTPPGFMTLTRRYLRKAEDDWADNAGSELALHGLRKVAAIAIRGMRYCGIRHRK